MFNITKLDNKEVAKLPVSIRILLEAAVRNCDSFNIQEADIAKIINWKETSEQDVEVPFKPARVIL
jgi:aconitate hydratase